MVLKALSARIGAPIAGLVIIGFGIILVIDPALNDTVGIALAVPDFAIGLWFILRGSMLGVRIHDGAIEYRGLIKHVTWPMESIHSAYLEEYEGPGFIGKSWTPVLKLGEQPSYPLISLTGFSTQKRFRTSRMAAHCEAINAALRAHRLGGRKDGL